MHLRVLRSAAEAAAAAAAKRRALPVNPTTTTNPFEADLGDELIPIEDNPAALLIVCSRWIMTFLLVISITLL